MTENSSDTVAEFVFHTVDPAIMVIFQKRSITIMSLKPNLIEAVPADTARVARAAFPKGNLYLAMRDELGVLFKDADFAELFPRRGQPAFAP